MNALALFDDFAHQSRKLLPDPATVSAAQIAARREIEWLIRERDTAMRDFDLLKGEIARSNNLLIALRGSVFADIQALEDGDRPAAVAQRLRVALDGQST